MTFKLQESQAPSSAFITMMITVGHKGGISMPSHIIGKIKAASLLGPGSEQNQCLVKEMHFQILQNFFNKEA
jgi:hypothetical protein